MLALLQSFFHRRSSPGTLFLVLLRSGECGSSPAEIDQLLRIYPSLPSVHEGRWNLLLLVRIFAAALQLWGEN